MGGWGRMLMGGGDPNNKVQKQNIKWEIRKLWEPIYWSQTPPVLHKYLPPFIFKPFFFVKLNRGILEHVVSLAKALLSTLAEKFSMCSVPLLPHCLRFLGMPRLSRSCSSICNFGFVPLCIVARCLGVVVVKWGIIATHTNWMEWRATTLPQQQIISSAPKHSKLPNLAKFIWKCQNLRPIENTFQARTSER